MDRSFTLAPGSQVGLIACSDGLRPDFKPQLDELIRCLNGFGVRPKCASTLMRKDSYFSGSPAERAQELNKLFSDPGISAIFDISGGDSANQILPFVDFEVIRASRKPFFGLSDLSVILNAIYAASHVPAFHYQVMNLVYDESGEQRRRFFGTLFEESRDLYDFNYRWIRGDRMQGTVIGGNIRCFLKLAGTRFIPDPAETIIFLESLGGRAGRIASLVGSSGSWAILTSVKESYSARSPSWNSTGNFRSYRNI
ncbi:S66 peptidase family protein [Paenibacillus caui]|uniref:S66 peptidase family protein n=1 Tax=Paenibacillus caui TaxID=2873927 RepID=UPI001CAA28EC|nr:LD-carboxypeptidase [Paenibacillus caui]